MNKWMSDSTDETKPLTVCDQTGRSCVRECVLEVELVMVSGHQVLLIASLLHQRCCTGPDSDKSRDIHNLARRKLINQDPRYTRQTDGHMTRHHAAVISTYITVGKKCTLYCRVVHQLHRFHVT